MEVTEKPTQTRKSLFGTPKPITIQADTPATKVMKKFGVNVKDMPTPKTPYGAYNPREQSGPSPMTRKLAKLAIDSLPNEPVKMNIPKAETVSIYLYLVIIN